MLHRREVDLDQWAIHNAAGLYAADAINILSVGVQLVMLIYGLSCFLETPYARRKGRLRYIIFSLCITALSMMGTGLNLSEHFRTVYYSVPGADYLEQNGIAQKSWELRLSLALAYVGVTLGDGLLVYRCYVIWNGLKRVTIPLFVGYISFIAITITEVVRHASGIAQRSENQRAMSLKIHIVYILVTLLLNISATSLIVYRLLNAQKNFTNTLPGRKMSVYTNVSRILIESALPLTIFGFIYAVLVIITIATRSPSGVPNLAYNTASAIMSAVYTAFAALSPQMIIFRVNTGRSITHRDGENTTSLDPKGLSQPLAFKGADLSSFGDSAHDRHGVEFGHEKGPQLTNP